MDILQNIALLILGIAIVVTTLTLGRQRRMIMKLNEELKTKAPR